MKMRKVFEENWVENMKARYEKPGVSAPPVFRVATLDKWKPIRDEIEKWFARLSETSQEKIVRNIRNPDSFLQAYNELVVAGLFLQLGYELEYENQMENLTPDWLVKIKDEAVFIIEVFTRTVSNEVEAEQIRISELWDRLRKIPVGVGLLISYENLNDKPILNSSLTKKIANEVRSWLESESPRPDTVKIFYGLKFKLLNYKQEWSRPALAGPSSGAFFVSNEPVRKGIEEKANKYKNLSNSLKLPLVVAIVPSFETAIELEDLNQILLGDEVSVLTGENTERYFRENNGIFNKRPVLSAVIGLWRDSVCNYRTAIYHNPDATYPLSKEHLKT